jgi:hypothetical protein
MIFLISVRLEFARMDDSGSSDDSEEKLSILSSSEVVGLLALTGDR